MFADPEVLDHYGCSAEKWQKIFSQPRDKRPDKVNQLIDRIRRRLQAGRDMNMEHHLVYKGLDDAWDAAMKQLSPTLLRTLMDKGGDQKDVAEILKTWDLDPSEVLVEVPDPKSPGKNIKKVSVPAFFRILVPLCAAYVKIRWAKIVQDRNYNPFMKFEPIVSDEISRLKCDVLTARIQEMSRQYGFYDTWKQIVFRVLHYGECLQFPVEEWHTAYQMVEKDAPYEGEVEGKYRKVIVQEGLRYHLPTPTRTYYDRNHFASTFNTDTGCEFAGYWRVVRWKDVADNEHYYNKESCSFTDFNEWYKNKKTHTYWVNTLRGCVLNFPGTIDANTATSDYDNQKQMVKWYSNDLADAPIVITEHFEKIIPKDWGLGDYEYPIWARFCIAADTNVIYAAPMSYAPGKWYGYDWAEGRTHNASMTLETLPFQDQFSQLLTQILLTTRQNLANITFMNTDVMDEETIAKVTNLGERWWRGFNVVRASFKAIFKKQLNEPTKDILLNYKMPFTDVTQLYQAMKIILDTLERVLVMSAQEVGQAASHEQTKKEIEHIMSQTSVRAQFTADGLNPGFDSWKKQCYYALMAHGQKSFYVQVPMEKKISPELLTKLGFTYKSEYDEKNRAAYLKANKTALLYESFADDRDSNDRINSAEVAKNILGEFSNLLANPMMAQAIGPDQAIRIINYINKFLGFPNDFQLVNANQQTPDQQMQQMQQALMQMKQYVDQAIQKSSEEIVKDAQGAIQQITEKNQQQDQALTKVLAGIQQIMGMINGGGQPQLQPPEAAQFDTFQGNGQPQAPVSPEDMRLLG